MSSAKQWTIVLRCYRCNGRFTLRRLVLDRLFVVPQIAPCPHCTARPFIAAGPGAKRESKLHGIFDLREETEPTYRKTQEGDTWHFNRDCSQWPSGDYVELDITPKVGQFCSECKAGQDP